MQMYVIKYIKSSCNSPTIAGMAWVLRGETHRGHRAGIAESEPLLCKVTATCYNKCHLVSPSLYMIRFNLMYLDT